MVQICALASGSNGNCYYVGNEHEAVIIDIGISNRQLGQRLRDAGLSLRKIKAVFITHEHTDHIKGMRVVCEKNNIQGFATKKTYERTRRDFRSAKINYFEPGDSVEIGSIKVHSFSKQHDAVDPVSFRVEIDGINVAVLTDLGTACSNVKEHIAISHAAFLECNYDNDLLATGKYPAFLKQRVSSDHGHMSNDQAFELVKRINGSPLKTIFLSHISADNNRVDIAMDTFKMLEKTHIIIPTSRYSISKVVEFE